MKTIIYYMSGTGNSLYVAKRIQESLKSYQLFDIGHLHNKKNEISADRIGFVFPSYCQDAPSAVKRFIESLKIKTDNPYIFSICTHNNVPGKPNETVQDILNRKKLKLNYGVDICMPGNSLIIKDYTNPKEEQDRRLGLSNSIIDQFIIDISYKEEKITKHTRPISTLFLEYVSEFTIFKFYKLHKRFFTDDDCTSCGLCKKVCSFNAIELIDKKPVWNNKCQSCLGCLHYCPTRAINFSNKTKHQTRYQHPEINASCISKHHHNMS